MKIGQRHMAYIRLARTYRDPTIDLYMATGITVFEKCQNFSNLLQSYWIIKNGKMGYEMLKVNMMKFLHSTFSWPGSNSFRNIKLSKKLMPLPFGSNTNHLFSATKGQRLDKYQTNIWKHIENKSWKWLLQDKGRTEWWTWLKL